MLQCKGKTLKGKKCERKVTKGEYCYLHYDQDESFFKQEKPSECPICCEKMIDKHPMSCGHWVCVECVIKSAKPECPICRQKIIMTEHALKKINILAQKNKEETIREEQEYILSNLEDAEIDIIVLDAETHARVVDIINEHVDHASRNNTDIATLLNNILTDIITNYSDIIL